MNCILLLLFGYAFEVAISAFSRQKELKQEKMKVSRRLYVSLLFALLGQQLGPFLCG